MNIRRIFLSAQHMLPDYAACAVRKLANLYVSPYRTAGLGQCPKKIWVLCHGQGFPQEMALKGPQRSSKQE